MTAIATPLPEDIVAACDGIVAFAEREILPRHARHQALFDDPRAFSVQRIIKLFGHIGRDEAEIAFDDLYVRQWCHRQFGQQRGRSF